MLLCASSKTKRKIKKIITKKNFLYFYEKYYTLNNSYILETSPNGRTTKSYQLPGTICNPKPKTTKVSRFFRKRKHLIFQD